MPLQGELRHPEKELRNAQELILRGASLVVGGKENFVRSKAARVREVTLAVTNNQDF